MRASNKSFCCTFYHVPPPSFTLIPTLLSPDRTGYVPRSSRPPHWVRPEGTRVQSSGIPTTSPGVFPFLWSYGSSVQPPVRSRVPFSTPLHDHFHDLPTSSALYEEPPPSRSWASTLFCMKLFIRRKTSLWDLEYGTLTISDNRFVSLPVHLFGCDMINIHCASFQPLMTAVCSCDCFAVKLVYKPDWSGART